MISQLNKPIDNYPGSKEGPGTYQTIINQIPPHQVYIEPFLGGGAIMRKKKAAKRNIGIDRNHKVVESWQNAVGEQKQLPESCLFEFKQANALEYLKHITKSSVFLNENVFVYCDPPYPIATRKQKRQLYKTDMTMRDHKSFLALIKELPFNCMVSMYDNDLYTESLLCSDWRLMEFRSMTRGGMATEQLWLNYPEPKELHEYTYLGNDMTDRQRIKRKVQRQVDYFKRLPPLERHAIIEQLTRAGII